MILSDKKIEKMLKDGSLTVTPLEKYQIQPASVDIRLGSHFLIVEETQMTNLSLDSEVHYRELNQDEIVIPPKSFVLASTMEYIELPNNLTAFVEGRSSIGRLGLFIQNAGWVDPGFKGKITLQIYNANSLPIKLNAGRRLSQLVFAEMDQEAKNPYNGKYQGQKGAAGSQVCNDHEIN